MQSQDNAGAKVVPLKTARRARERRVEAIRQASRKNLIADPMAAAVLAGAFEWQASNVEALAERTKASRLPMPANVLARLAAIQSELETLAGEIELASSGEVA